MCDRVNGNLWEQGYVEPCERVVERTDQIFLEIASGTRDQMSEDAVWALADELVHPGEDNREKGED